MNPIGYEQASQLLSPPVRFQSVATIAIERKALRDMATVRNAGAQLRWAAGESAHADTSWREWR